jgi:transcriptional regulator with XRE-family HTH domain
MSGSVRDLTVEGVMTATDSELTGEQSQALAVAVREELARRRLSRQFLADKAKLSLSTLEKALSGSRPFTLSTVIRLEEALGVKLRQVEPPVRAPDHGLAPDELGSYARPAVAWLIGGYLTLRPSFGDPRAIYAYRIDIAWDETASCLVFQEAARLDTPFTQFGNVAVPHQSGHIYLVTNRHGQYRMMVLGRPRIEGEMYGVLTSLKAGRGSQLTPVSTSIALVPLTNLAAEPAFGRITPEHPAWSDYRAHLERVIEDGFAVFAGIVA